MSEKEAVGLLIAIGAIGAFVALMAILYKLSKPEGEDWPELM